MMHHGEIMKAVAAVKAAFGPPGDYGYGTREGDALYALYRAAAEAVAASADKRACIERELRLRRRVYPRWVETGRMTQAAADREIALMEAILADYPPAQGELIR